MFTRTWEGYCRGLKHSPTLTLSSYCAVRKVDYKGMRYWLESSGLTVAEAKRMSRSGERIPRSDSGSSPGSGTFVQFVSRPRSSAMLRGATIMFPDGVSLSLKECSPEEVVALLDAYSARGGASPCSR